VLKISCGNILRSITSTTYNGFVSEISKYETKQDLINSRHYDNSLIILDEVHNIELEYGKNTDKMLAKIIEEVDNDDVKYSKNKVDKFKAIYRLKDTGATIIFMSASILIN